MRIYNTVNNIMSLASHKIMYVHNKALQVRLAYHPNSPENTYVHYELNDKVTTRYIYIYIYIYVLVIPLSTI